MSEGRMRHSGNTGLFCGSVGHGSDQLQRLIDIVHGDYLTSLNLLKSVLLRGIINRNRNSTVEELVAQNDRRLL